MVAQIVKCSPCADSYQASLPWQLLFLDGRIRRFPYLCEARDEAMKLWPGCRFERH
jgi:hypothetical protein